METFSVVLTFKSVDEILWRDHSNKTPLGDPLGGAFAWYHLFLTRE